MKALITGISGMDGSNLSEYLLSLGYEIYGIIRRNSTPEHQESRIANLQVTTFYGDVTDPGSIEKVMSEVMPDEIYNLAAQSHVRISFDIPQYTAQVNAIGAMNVLEAYRKICPKARLYQASSSEMFGNSVDKDGFQRESTPMFPVSPYGCSKLFAYSAIRNYRNAYKLHAINGILFNHSGARRGSNFVEQKITKTAVMISKGLTDKLELGNIKSSRDIGNSKDYVRAMHLMLQQDSPGDWVVATGESISIEQICTIVFNYLNLKAEEYIHINPKYFRPEELQFLHGDSSRMRSLGWEPQYDIIDTLVEMIKHWQRVFETRKKEVLY